MLSAALADHVRRLIPSLGSSFDGEVIAARNAIVRALSAGGADWHGLAASITGSDTSSAPRPTCSAEPPAFGDLARACRDLNKGRLSDRERAFVVEMCALGFAWQPSPKQLAWLRAIYDSLRPRAAA